MNITAKGLKDDMPITNENVWEKKGYHAPGAIDMDRRVAVMDAQGIGKQLIFPGFGHIAFIQAAGGDMMGIPKMTPQQIALGGEAVKAHNKWAAKHTRRHPDRVSIVGMLHSGAPGLTPEALTKQTEELIETGVKAIQIFAGMPPAGIGPADRRLDPFYAAFAQSNTALVFHPPSWMGYRASNVWEMGMPEGVDPFVTGVYQSMENFLSIMILGGVFDRHPTLRVGFVETGVSWLGPLVERIEMGPVKKIPLGHLELKPSEYLARNVRAAALLAEPVDYWFERYPHLQDVYCYASDYPHPEGLKYSMQEFYDRIARLGDTIVEKFFVKNPQLILS
jgi:predicted TIM-barrel fold metal-dependent hydrolase